MNESEQSFDDPSLGEALRSLRGGHRASSRLRQRVLNQMAELKEREAYRIEHRQNGRWMLALAATIAIAVGLFWLTSEDSKSPSYTYKPSGTQTYSASAYVLSSMVQAHQLGITAGNNESAPAAPLDRDRELADESTRHLGRTIPVPQMGATWKLDAAKYCDVYGVAAIRFHFTKAPSGDVMPGDARPAAISILSLPATAWPGAHEGDHYEVTSGENAIAGYIHDGSLNCIVGDAGMSLADVTALRDQLRRS